MDRKTQALGLLTALALAGALGAARWPFGAHWGMGGTFWLASLLAIAGMPPARPAPRPGLLLLAAAACSAWAGLMLTHSKPLFGIGWGLAAAWALTAFRGWPGWRAAAIWTAGTPLFALPFSAASLPLRMALGEALATCFRWAGLPATAKGSSLLWQGQEFAIDEACAGLHLMGAGMAVGLALLGARQREMRRELPARMAVGYALLLFSALLLANLARMAGIVLLRVPAGDWAHQTIGLMALALYAWLPAYWLAGAALRRWGRPEASEAHRAPRWQAIGALGLALGWVWAGHAVASRPEAALSGKRPALPEAAQAWDWAETHPNIWKASGPGWLVYVKAHAAPLRAVHSPADCWPGGGIALRQARAGTAGGQEAYWALLDAPGEKSPWHTAWWLECQHGHRRIGAWAWRWEAFANGCRYRLVNLTASNEAGLRALVAAWLAHEGRRDG
jgi:exosortase N